MFVRKRYWLFFGLVAFFVVGTFYLIVLREVGSGGWWLAWVDPIIADDKRVSMWTDVVTTLATVGAAIYAVVQYLSIRRSQRQEKAATVLRMYATRLMYHVNVILQIFEDYDNINTIIQKIDRNEPLRFTRDELAKYPVTAKDISVYNNFLSNHQIRTLERPMEKDEGDKGAKVKKHCYVDLLPKDVKENFPEDYSLAAYVAFTLNELEHMSMEIESGAADDNYLYGSLHHSFLRFVHSAAMLIQKINIRSVDDENYYLYTSRLYRRWVIKENKNHKLVGKAFKTSEKRRKRHEKLL